ncbi:MAG: DUF2341 domain-containing protein [Kiritimatiellae bacterium]|nr:DUF2341 domain-containing protein [Kiritimatiellia bacterium]
MRAVPPILSLLAVLAFAAPAARAADADATGLVPTIWFDFETKPDAAGLKNANKGSASISFSNKGTAAYGTGATNGWALNTVGFSPYSASGGQCSTAGNAFTVSAVMTLGTNTNGVTLNVRCETAEKDLVVRRGSAAGSLVVGLGPQKAVSKKFLNATLSDGDTAFHLVSVVAEQSGTSLYVDGDLVTNSTEFSLWHASGCASRMQFGERLSSNQSPEVAYGGLVDDLRIHDAALTPAQMKAIAAEYGLVPSTDMLEVSGAPANWGTVVPAYGTTNGLAQGDAFPCSAAGSETASTKIVPIGHSLYAVAADGTATLVDECDATSFVYTHGTTRSRLVWRWAQSNLVSVAAGAGGTVSESGWAGYGDAFAAAATPDPGFRFLRWTGDTAGIDARAASVVLPSVTAPRSIAAEFISESVDETVQWVSPSGDDGNDGYSESSPKKTIAAAVACLSTVDESKTCTVHVAPGRYTISSPISLARAVRLLGDDADPSLVVVSNKENVAWGNTNHRCVLLNHPDALASGMTFENGKDYGDGGNVRIDTNGGMVTNCILVNGFTREGNQSGGANVAIAGPGLVTHCRILGGSMNNCSGCDRVSSVYLAHADARIENCLVDGFRGATTSIQPTVGCAGILVNKGTAVNCTVVNCTSPYTTASGFAGILVWANGSALNCASVANVDSNGTLRAFSSNQVARTSHCAFDAIAGEAAVPEGMVGAVVGTAESFFPHFADDAIAEVKYRPGPGSPLLDAGADYAPMPAFDLSGRQARRIGAAVDIGCYEDMYLAIEATGESTVGLESFATDFSLGSDVPADVAVVWSADASFADASTNTVAEGVTNGVHEAAIAGLEPDLVYWWKLVADNGAIAVETAPASFRTLGAPTFDEVSETVSGPTAVFSVGLASLARDELGNGLRTYVTVYYTTNGTDYVELSLGSATRARMLAGSATLPNGDCTWYARAYADYGGRTIEARTGLRTFRVFHNATPPAGFHRLDATISYQGEAAEDIPLLLRLSESIEGFRYANVANNGRDFLFSDGDGNPLPFEIDTWNPAGESLVWVRVPVFTNGAVVHLDYGASEADGTADAADVWRRYVAVWHMNELRTDAASGRCYTPDSTASGWHAYKTVEADAVPAPVTTATGATANPTPPTGTAMNVAYGAGKSKTSLGGFTVPASRTSATTLNGPGFTLSAFVNSHQAANDGRCRVIAFGNAPGDRANLAVGGDRIYCMGSNSHYKTNPKGATGWVHAAAVFGSKSFVYADGANLSGSGDNPNLKSLALDKGIGLGCFTDGTQCLDGYIDEARIRNAASTASWAAAEYAAMADPDVVRFGAARYLQIPVLDGAPSLAWAMSFFRYSAAVSYGLGDVLLTTVDLHDGSATTNATHSFDSVDQLPQSFSDAVSLGENRMYRAVAVLRSSDGSEEELAAAEETVYSGQLIATWIQDADVAAMTPAIVRLARADTEAATCADLTVAVSLSGEAVSKGLVAPVASATIPAGESYVDVEIRPVARSVVPGSYTATLAVAGKNVANPDGDDSRAEFGVRNAGADPYVRFVAPDGNDENDGALATRPKRTIAAALASFSENARASLCTVHVAPGLYPISSPIVLANPVRVLGDDPDPVRVVVSNTVTADYYRQDQRVFRLDHADALVANLTMRGGQEYGHGGDFKIEAAGGTVSNCVVETGYTRDNGKAAGGWLDGGLVTHTVFRNNASGSGSASWDGNRPGVLQLNNSARAENCLFAGNDQHASVTLINVYGNSVMRNCTIVDSSLSRTNENCRSWSALNIGSGATVLNTVVAGVTNTVDGATCLLTGSVARFRNGAFDGDVADRGFPADTVVGTAASFFRARTRGDWRPKSGGPLVGAGANYEPMAGTDLSGVQPRKIGTRVDIGCYEAFAETTILIFR